MTYKCLFICFFLALPSFVYCQNLESILFGQSYAKLEIGIRKSSKLQAIYAYDIANLATPGFNPILPPEDVRTLKELTISGRTNKDILLEFLMGKMSENAKRYTSYLTLWKSDIDLLRRIVTLGK